MMMLVQGPLQNLCSKLFIKQCSRHLGKEGLRDTPHRPRPVIALARWSSVPGL